MFQLPTASWCYNFKLAFSMFVIRCKENKSIQANYFFLQVEQFMFASNGCFLWLRLYVYKSQARIASFPVLEPKNPITMHCPFVTIFFSIVWRLDIFFLLLFFLPFVLQLPYFKKPIIPPVWEHEVAKLGMHSFKMKTKKRNKRVLLTRSALLLP